MAQFLRIGDRVINLDAITQVRPTTFDEHERYDGTGSLITVEFDCSFTVLCGDEAAALLSYLKAIGTDRTPKSIPVTDANR